MTVDKFYDAVDAVMKNGKHFPDYVFIWGRTEVLFKDGTIQLALFDKKGALTYLGILKKTQLGVPASFEELRPRA